MSAIEIRPSARQMRAPRLGRLFDSGTDALYTAFLTLDLIWRIGFRDRNKKVWCVAGAVVLGSPESLRSCREDLSEVPCGGVSRVIRPDLILVSPGPGRPRDFGVPDLIRHAASVGIPVFGVCLGLQGMVEAFGGELGVLDYPMHGKPSRIRHHNTGVFEGLPEEFTVGRYHSLYAIPEKMPACFEVTAQTADGVIMGVRHKELPLEAVQFHPESILSARDDLGLRLMRNAMRLAQPSLCR